MANTPTPPAATSSIPPPKRSSANSPMSTAAKSAARSCWKSTLPRVSPSAPATSSASGAERDCPSASEFHRQQSFVLRQERQGAKDAKKRNRLNFLAPLALLAH